MILHLFVLFVCPQVLLAADSSDDLDLYERPFTPTPAQITEYEGVYTYLRTIPLATSLAVLLTAIHAINIPKEHTVLYRQAVTDYKQHYRLLSSLFFHQNLNHLGQNLFGLWTMVGFAERRGMPPTELAIVYLASGVMAGSMYIALTMNGGLGASAALLGTLLYTAIDRPQKQAFMIVLLSMAGIITQSLHGQEINVGHVAGVCAGILLISVKKAMVYLCRSREHRLPNM